MRAYSAKKDTQVQELHEQYQKLLPQLQEDIADKKADAQSTIDILTAECNTIQKNLVEKALAIGIVEQYATNATSLYGIKRMVSSGRADSVKEALNLLEMEKLEEQRVNYSKQQADYAKEQANAAQQLALQNAAFQEQQLEIAKQEAEYSKQKADEWLEEQQRFNKHLEEMEENEQTAERDRGKEQCRSCKLHYDCRYKYSNNGSCASFIPYSTI